MPQKSMALTPSIKGNHFPNTGPLRYNSHTCFLSKEHIMYQYKSDTTQFLDAYLEEHPEEKTKQLQHRGMLWDVALNPEDEANFKAASLPKKGYSYQSE